MVCAEFVCIFYHKKKNFNRSKKKIWTTLKSKKFVFYDLYIKSSSFISCQFVNFWIFPLTKLNAIVKQQFRFFSPHFFCQNAVERFNVVIEF